MFDSFIFTWRDGLDIILVTIFFYYILYFVRGTRALSVLQGLLLLFVIYIFSRIMNLFTFSWLLESLFGSLFLVIVILFSDDIKKALSSINFKTIFQKRQHLQTSFIDILINTCMDLAKTHTGAIIVIERDVPLGDYLSKGVTLDAKISSELLRTIFFLNTPLHDGAVIINREGRIVAAGCVLPLAHINERKNYGTRHRAAIGVTEVSDAIALVVSEERGMVAMAHKGNLSNALNQERMERVLSNVLN